MPGEGTRSRGWKPSSFIISVYFSFKIVIWANRFEHFSHLNRDVCVGICRRHCGNRPHLTDNMSANEIWDCEFRDRKINRRRCHSQGWPDRRNPAANIGLNEIVFRDNLLWIRLRNSHLNGKPQNWVLLKAYVERCSIVPCCVMLGRDFRWKLKEDMMGNGRSVVLMDRVVVVGR